MKKMISIIIPVYNAKDYILETIASVLAQSYSDWELLLVEDGSTDGTKELLSHHLKQLQDSRIRLLPKENGGAAKARNYGLKQAGGRYIAFLDADDLWAADKLEKQLAFVEKKKAAFCFTGYEFADAQGKGTGKIVRVPDTLVYKQALQNTTIFTSTVLFDMDKIPKKELEMPVIKSEDTALWFRLLRKGYVAYGLNENLVRYRRTGGTLSSNKLEAIRRIWRLYRQQEHLSFAYSLYNFCFWAVRAVKRRI